MCVCVRPITKAGPKTSELLDVELSHSQISHKRSFILQQNHTLEMKLKREMVGKRRGMEMWFCYG